MNELSITLFAYVLTFICINGKTIAPSDNQRQQIYSQSRAMVNPALTAIENLLHTLTTNGVFQTYNNAICIEMHNQLHLHTVVYSKWSIINVN